MKSITVGTVEITSLTDVEGAFFRLDQIFPGVTGECRQNDNDGITRLTCETKIRGESHDAADSRAANPHCFRTDGVGSGPCTDRCRGKCGPNCNPFLTKGWTQDCLDHDSCSYHHNASKGTDSILCGDEYEEARQDFYQTQDQCRPCFAR